MLTQKMLGRIAAVMVILGASVGEASAYASDEALAAMEASREAGAQTASLRIHIGRAAGLTQNVSSMEAVCAKIVRKVSQQGGGAETRPARELRQLMKGLRCVE